MVNYVRYLKELLTGINVFRDTYVYEFNIKMYVTYFNIHFSKKDKPNLAKCKLLFIPGSGYMSSLYYSLYFCLKIFIIKNLNKF